jgi:hypothetical protein
MNASVPFNDLAHVDVIIENKLRDPQLILLYLRMAD